MFATASTTILGHSLPSHGYGLLFLRGKNDRIMELTSLRVSITGCVHTPICLHGSETTFLLPLVDQSASFCCQCC